MRPLGVVAAVATLLGSHLSATAAFADDLAPSFGPTSGPNSGPGSGPGSGPNAGQDPAAPAAGTPPADGAPASGAQDLQGAQSPQSPQSAPAAAGAGADGPSPICTDRPTKSNVACSVDAGRLQVEADLFNTAYGKVAGVKTDVTLFTNPTLKYGVTRTLDLEVSMAPYEVVRTSDGLNARSTLGGIGDLYLRAKDNFIGDADSRLAVAIIPYVKVPTARQGIGDGALEGGAILPVDYKLTSALTLALAPEVDILKDGRGDGRHLNTAQLINLSYSLPSSITVYGELWGDWNFDPAGTIRQVSADLAVTWGVTKRLQFDAGVNLGLNRETPAVQPYIGVSQKF